MRNLLRILSITYSLTSNSRLTTSTWCFRVCLFWLSPQPFICIPLQMLVTSYYHVTVCATCTVHSMSQLPLAASSTKNTVWNTWHGIQVHSWLGSIIPGITQKPTSSCLVGPICDPPHLANSTFLARRLDSGKWSFAVNGTVVWNSLPAELQSPDISLNVFKGRLKISLCLTADLVHLVYLF